MTLPPLMTTWDGEHLVPFPRFMKRCDKELVIGENYQVQLIEERSARSHNHYFASIHELWMSLPEDLAERFPTEEHLRKHALIKAGFYDQRSIVGESKAAATRIAAFIRQLDEYAIVIVEGNTVTQYTAKSQSSRAMGKEVFQDSKQKVLDVISEMVGVDSKTVPTERQA